MDNDEVVLSRFVVNKVWQVAQSCLDKSRKGWRVKMLEFRDAMDSLDFTANEVRAALAFLESRMYVFTFTDEDGHVTGISLIPQRHQCAHCNMWLDMQDDAENHIALCLKQQKKIERNRMLL
jgi:hypothetical protein